MAVLFLIVCGCSAWVYWDASGHHIGKVKFEPYDDYEGRPVRKRFTNLTAWEWGLAVLFLWILAFPLYLSSRSRLLAIAEEEPKLSRYRGARATALLAPGMVLLLLAISAGRPGALAACESPQVQSIVQGMLAKAAGQPVVLRSPAEVMAESIEWRRVCRVEVITSVGSSWQRFSVEPHGRDQLFIQVLTDAGLAGADAR